MKKIHLQNLIAICDLAVQKGLIHPDDLINVGLSRKAAIDMVTSMEDADTLEIKPVKDTPGEAKEKKHERG